MIWKKSATRCCWLLPAPALSSCIPDFHVFWIKNRTNEIGILLSIGIAKGKILLQILTEAVLIGVLALALSFLIAPAVSGAAADYLAGQQAGQAELQDEMDAGKAATDYQATGTHRHRCRNGNNFIYAVSRQS